MSEATREAIEQALKEVEDPYLQRDLVSAGCLREVRVEGDTVTISVVLGYPPGD
ncbi:MAG: iron-sulfur cluster assembly protein, partial [Halorhodospira sp.]